jgi:antitoxin (DNA-binding transcriptional repressor) of toxin-antitoxin stability system
LLLDAVEHRGETFVVVRNGRPVARIAPVPPATGRVLKDVLAKHPADAHWRRELYELRSLLTVEGRNWPD